MDNLIKNIIKSRFNKIGNYSKNNINLDKQNKLSNTNLHDILVKYSNNKNKITNKTISDDLV